MRDENPLQRLRESATLLLIVFLPMHALLVTVGTRVLRGANQAPWSLLAVWKEALLLGILCIALIEFLRRPKDFFNFDLLDLGISLFLLIAILVSVFTHGNPSLILYGLKYDCIPLIAFLVLRRVPWSLQFWRRAELIIIILGVVLCVYGLVAVLLPQSFFTWLGYSDLHSLYFPNRPIAAFQQIGGSSLRRLQSAFSGPNQFGAWLLLPFSLLLWQLRESQRSWRTLLLLVIVAVGVAGSYSRAAWVAAIAMTCIAIFSLMPKEKLLKGFSTALCLFTCLALFAFLFSPSVLVRMSSSRDHFQKPLEALMMLGQHPLGLGLGSVGPASSRVSDTCVYLEPKADITWAKDIKDLCVFVDDKQVQPSLTDRTCACPFHPENWFLQIALETGVIGGILYLFLLGYLIFQEWNVARWVSVAFIGVCIMSLFLHAWEDAAVAYTVFILCSASLTNTRLPKQA